MEDLKYRKELVRRINKIENMDIIDEIYRLLDINLNDSLYELNEFQNQEIEQARREIENGDGIPSCKVNDEIDRWLKQ